VFCAGSNFDLLSTEFWEKFSTEIQEGMKKKKAKQKRKIQKRTTLGIPT